MTEMAKTTAAPAVRVHDGTRYEFPMLKRRHVGKLLAAWAAEDRAALLKSLDESGAEPELKAKRLEEFDRESRLVTHGYRSLFEFERSGEAVLMSMRIAEPETTDDALDNLPFTQDEITGIASELWGFKIGDVTDEGDDDENPTGSRPTGG